MTFEAEAIGGELRLSDETIGYGYFSVDSLSCMDLVEPHLERIQDALENLPDAVMK
jgi:hypothetical protein